MNTSTSPVLEFDDVSFEGEEYDTPLEGFNLSLSGGDAVIIRMEDGHANVPVADMAQGLVSPLGGSVRFLGNDWGSAPPDEAIQLRSEIGRVFEREAWVSNLDVDENITLAERHLTDRPLEDIAKEAQALAREFGLEQIPAGRPAWVKRSDLRRLEWVRAFLGNPRLILLERPARDVYAAAIPALVSRVRRACDEGAAVLCLTSEDSIVGHNELVKARHYALDNGKLSQVSGVTT